MEGVDMKFNSRRFSIRLVQVYLWQLHFALHPSMFFLLLTLLTLKVLISKFLGTNLYLSTYLLGELIYNITYRLTNTAYISGTFLLSKSEISNSIDE